MLGCHCYRHCHYHCYCYFMNDLAHFHLLPCFVDTDSQEFVIMARGDIVGYLSLCHSPKAAVTLG